MANNKKFNQGNKRPNNRRKSNKSEECGNVAASGMPHVVTDSKASNDPSWYTHIYPLAKDVASLSFNVPTGQIFDATLHADSTYPEGWTGPRFSWDTRTSGLPNYGYYTVPGIMMLEVTPILGACTGPNDAANIAAQEEYTMVRKANSGAINYDKTDLMMLNLAMDSAYMLYEYLLRAYRTFGMYATMNRYMPDALLQAQGFSPALNTQLANFRTMMDMFAYSLASINIPDQFDFIKRHSWMFTHVYKDSPLEKASMYLFRPAGFYVWTEGEGDKATYLHYTERKFLFNLESEDAMITSLEQIQDAINKIMTPILGSQDVGTISGDLAKAFGEGGMIKIRPVEDHEALIPAYDMEVISQIENARIFHQVSNLDVVQQLSDTVAGPYLEQNIRLNSFDAVKRFLKPLLNLHSASPTPEEIVVATRLIGTVGDPVVETDWSYFTVDSVGTEIVTGCTIYQFSISVATGKRVLKEIEVYQEMPVGDMPTANPSILAAKAANLATVSAAMTAFAHHPTIYLIGRQSEQWDKVSNPGVFAGVLQDYDNYVWLEPDSIRNMNTAAVLSEFAVKDYPMF